MATATIGDAFNSNVDTSNQSKFNAQTGSVSEIVDMSGAVFNNSQGLGKEDLNKVLEATSQTVSSSFGSIFGSSGVKMLALALIIFSGAYAYKMIKGKK